MPELTLVPRLLGGVRRRWVVAIIAGTVAFGAALAAVIFVWNAANEKTARQATTRFGAALVHNDPRAAPPGAAEYVGGARVYFGAVTSARVIGSHQRAVGHEPDTRSFYVAELLLGTRRGPAVVEVEFDNASINSDRVSSAYELAPGSAPGLTSAERSEVAVAFRKRGNTPADATTLAMAAVSTPTRSTTKTPSVPTPSASSGTKPSRSGPASTATSDPATSAAARRLQCVEAAHGEVTKMARCAS